MKTPRLQSTGGRTCGSGTLAATASLLLATLPLAAADPSTITGTGYLVDVPVPGILCTNAAGQVSLKVNVHVLMVQADDPRATGRFQASMDLAYQADGTALFGGAAYQEVGTWDVADPTNPKFTPTGGLWQCNYHGVAQADGSDVITLTGYGVGGTIDGLRLEETITKGPGVSFDPAIPYLGSGSIKPAPVDTRVVLDDFDDNKVTGWSTGTSDGGAVKLVETNGQLTINWQAPSQLGWRYAAGMRTRPWSIQPGMTLEWRVELVSLSEHANASAIEIKQDDAHAYFFIKGHNYLQIGKWMFPDKIVFALEKTTLPSTDILLSGAMTRAGSDLILTARLLDKANPNLVLQEISAMDTPLRDPTLNTAQIEALTGVHEACPPDRIGAPYLYGNRYFLAVIQYTGGTALPVAEATFDNLELRAYEVPPVGIERAVRLTWPASPAVDFAVEGGPTVNGPWLPINDVATPGLKQMTIPANGDMQFFRLR
jgi:hypothetical protein